MRLLTFGKFHGNFRSDLKVFEEQYQAVLVEAHTLKEVKIPRNFLLLIGLQYHMWSEILQCANWQVFILSSNSVEELKSLKQSDVIKFNQRTYYQEVIDILEMRLHELQNTH
jgi:hypothetical protein